MKFITIGELLMRLSPPDYEKIRTTSSYVVNFGGAEANVAVSLANLGVDTTVFTVLPDNDIGRSAVRSLKAMMYIHLLLSSAASAWAFISLRKESVCVPLK